MPIAAEKEMEHIGESRGMANHDHDLIHELSKRLDALWRYDQYIANAREDNELADFWRDLKSQEQENVEQLKKFVVKHCEMHCF